MSNTLTITLDDAAVQAAFDRMLRFGRDASPMFAELSEHLLESTQRRFAAGTGPDGRPWVPLKSGRPRPLLDTGTLRDQIFASHGPQYAELAATTAYARFHQEGTRPYVILPKNKKALAFTGADGGKVMRKKVHHPGLPPRPFFGLSDQDRRDIEQIAGAYLDELADG